MEIAQMDTRSSAVDIRFGNRASYQPPRFHHGPLTAWYAGNDVESGSDPARDAYEEAVELFKKELTQDECKRIWLRDKCSIRDVQLAVTQARAEYEKASKRSKARIWLSRCSSRIIYYGNIMDVMVQTCPEYVAFAWGAMKFLFMAALNHEELVAEISKAISQIADVLPRAELLSVLYPTQRMKVAISQLFAKIIQFVQSAVRYYKKGRLAKSITAVVKPFALSFKQIIDDITDCSRRVDELANSASKAEIRDLHQQFKALSELAIANHSMQQQISLELRSQRVFFQQTQIQTIRSLPTLESIPSHDDALEYCRSMTRRRRIRLPCSLSLGDLDLLRSWVNRKASGILIAEAHGIKTSSIDFAVDFLDSVDKAGVSSIWALPQPAEEERAVTLEDLLISLILQAISLNPNALSEGVIPIAAFHFRKRESVEELLQLLRRSLKGLNFVIIVIDLTFLNKILERSKLLELDGFLEMLRGMMESHDGILKFVALTWKSEALIPDMRREIIAADVIATDPGLRKVRLMRNPRFRTVYNGQRGRLSSVFEARLRLGNTICGGSGNEPN